MARLRKQPRRWLRRRSSTMPRIVSLTPPGADLLADQLLDVGEILTLALVAERDRDPLLTSSPGASDAVDVYFGHVGRVEVEDVGHIFDIDPARRHVGADEQPNRAALQLGERLLPRVLRLVAVDRPPSGVQIEASVPRQPPRLSNCQAVRAWGDSASGATLGAVETSSSSSATARSSAASARKIAPSDSAASR